jgi:outer membrane protein OmpA-like peptidoglycan-associated protein
MRKHILLVILFVSALSAWAQQTNNSSNPNTSSVSQSDRDPIPDPRPKDFWDGEDPNFGNLVTHPITTKKYVQKYVGPIRDRINELDQLTAENSGQIKDVDARAKQGLQMASEKASLADQHASDSANKAQLAQAAANQASTRVSAAEQTVGNLDQYKGTAQTEIRFRAGQSELSKSAKDALDEMAGPLKDQRGYIIEVHGFSPGRGQTAIRNSQKMEESVVRYMVLNHNIPVYRIYTMSMGNPTVEGEGKHPGGARVEVNVLKNDLATSSQK